MTRLAKAAIAVAVALAVEIAAGAALVRVASTHAQLEPETREIVYDRTYYPRQHLVIEPETGWSWIETESGSRHYLTIGD